MTQDRRWAARTTEESEGDDGTVALLPLAAIEQHGPHLPLSTDLDIADGIVEAAVRGLPADFDLRILPTQAVGASPEHESFPGTLSLAPDLLEETVVQLCAAVSTSGIRRIVLFNAHGGNKATLDAAALRLRQALGLLVVKASWFRFPAPEDIDFPADEWRHGLHGGAVETSMMMHLHPDRVRADRIADFPSLGGELADSMRHLAPEGTASFAWLAEDLNPEGVTGSATLASAEAGHILVEHYGTVLADIVRDAADFPMDRLTGRDDG